VPHLVSADWLILLIIGFFVFSAGSSLKTFATGNREYLEGGRVFSGWLCGLALAAAGLGVQSPFLLGIGARWGFWGLAGTVLSGVVGLALLGRFFVPAYYGSPARTLPEFVAQRFGGKARAVAALLVLASAIAGAAWVLLVLARIFVATHLLEEPLHATGMGARGIFLAAMAAPSLLVLAYVLIGGLGGSIYNHAIAFFLFVAGAFPVALLSLKQVGWSGLMPVAAGSSAASGGSGVALAVAASLVLGMVFWCADFRVVQMVLAAKDARSARRAPFIAAAAWLVLPLLIIVPAIAALAMPTPQTITFVRNDNGVIYHEINVVSAADENGRGLVPAAIDPATGKPLRGADGRTLLNDELAAPKMLTQLLPAGLLGLGLAALVACAMSGGAASLTAFSAVFVYDIYQARLRKSASEGNLLAAGRWAAAAAMALAFGLACAAYFWNWKLDAAVLVLAGLHLPLLVVILLAIFWKRDPAALDKPPAASRQVLPDDLRIYAGILFTLVGTVLAAFGLGMRNHPEAYAGSLGINANLWWGLLVFVFGIAVLMLGRQGQMQIEKSKAAKKKK
jgi:SSS family solute:Na+ symporter